MLHACSARNFYFSIIAAFIQSHGVGPELNQSMVPVFGLDCFKVRRRSLLTIRTRHSDLEWIGKTSSLYLRDEDPGGRELHEGRLTIMTSILARDLDKASPEFRHTCRMAHTLHVCRNSGGVHLPAESTQAERPRTFIENEY